MKGDAFELTVSEFDLILGDRRRRHLPDHAAAREGALHRQAAALRGLRSREGREFTVVYRDKKRFAFGKRVQIEKFIRNREYQLIKDKAGKVDLLLPSAPDRHAAPEVRREKRQRVHEATFDLADLEVTGTAARGTRLAPKPVAQVKLVAKPTPTPKGGGGGKGEQATLF